mgnify:FL=1
MVEFTEQYYWFFYSWDLLFRSAAYITIIVLLVKIGSRLR